MIFKGEFCVQFDMINAVDDEWIEYKKQQQAADLGVLIGKSFGFVKQEEKTSDQSDIYALTIVAFKRSDWNECMNGLSAHFKHDTSALMAIGKLISTLEKKANGI